MRKIQLTFGMVAFASYLFLNGLLMAILSGVAFFQFTAVEGVVHKSLFSSILFFYAFLPTRLLDIVLMCRLVLGVYEIILGVCFLLRKQWALHISRGWVVLLILLTGLNPFQPPAVVIGNIFFYSIFFFYLFGNKMERLFQYGHIAIADKQIIEEAQPYQPRSNGVAFIGYAQIILGIIFVRRIFYVVPLQGIQFYLPLRFGSGFAVIIPKFLLLFAAAMLIFLGVCILWFRPIARKIFMFIYGLLIIALCAAMLLIDQESLKQYRYFYICATGMACIWSLFCFFLLINPHVKAQFKRRVSPRIWMRLIHIMIFAGLCFGMLAGLYTIMRKNPVMFEVVSQEKLFIEDETFEQLKTKDGAIAWAQQALGFDGSNVYVQEKRWESLNKNFLVHYQNQDLPAAEEYAKKALAFAEGNFLPGDPKIAVSANNLGLFYLTQEKYAEAEVLLKRALELNRASLGHDHPRVATDLSNLAQLYQQKKVYHKAESLFHEALDIYKKFYPEDHIYIKVIRQNLQDMYKQKHDDALSKQKSS